jgi:hypothetical protein
VRRLLTFILAIAALVTAVHYGLYGRFPAQKSFTRMSERALDNVRQWARRIETTQHERSDKVFNAGQ